MGEKLRYFQDINLVFETCMADKVNFDESLNLQLTHIKGGKNLLKKTGSKLQSIYSFCFETVIFNI